MENIWKVILGVFLSVMIIFSGLGILEANNENVAAEQYLYAVGAEISAANFAQIICQQKVEEAKNKRYELSIELVDVGNGSTMHTAYAILSMEYPYEIPLLQVSTASSKQLIVY